MNDSLFSTNFESTNKNDTSSFNLRSSKDEQDNLIDKIVLGLGEFCFEI